APAGRRPWADQSRDPGCAAGDRGVAAGLPRRGRGRAQEARRRSAGERTGPHPGQAGRDAHATGARRDAPGKKGIHGRPEEAQAVRELVSPTTGKRYPLTLICSVWRVARSTLREVHARRGPKPTLSDELLLEEIRTVLEDIPFYSEGHRKVRAHLRKKGFRVGKNRVLRVMRENGLLAPVRRKNERGDPTHSGTIRTDRPDEMGGTDATRFWTEEDGWCWFFGAVDHCTTEYAVPQLEWTPGRGYVEPLRGGGEWGNFAGAPMGAGCSRPPSRRSRSTASSGARLRFRGLRVSWTSAPPSCASGSGSSSRGRTRP